MSIQIKQESIPQGEEWWKWSIWLEGPAGDLDRVEHVEYILHPTFPQPVQMVKDRASNFRLDANGWGEFLIYANVHLKDGQVQKHEHWLSLAAQSAPTRSNETGAPLSLYLSCAAVDADYAGELVEALQREGFKITTNVDLDPAAAWESAVDARRHRFDAALFLVSNVKNPWFRREIEAMQKAGVPLLAVLLGEHPRQPAELKDVPHIRIKDLYEATYAAQTIAQRVREAGGDT